MNLTDAHAARHIRTENDFLHTVRQMASALRLRTFHPNSSWDPGWPDLAIAGPRGFMLRELKMPAQGLRPEQARWKWALLAAGVDYDVWFPQDLASGQIEYELRKIASTYHYQEVDEIA